MLIKSWLRTYAPLIAGLVPFVAIHASYLLAAGYEQVPWCNPYWDSCASISATGRQPPAFWWFKATMIPGAFMMMYFWWLTPGWYAANGLRSRTRARNAGMTACAFLMVYTVALGQAGDLFRLQRQIGATLYFTLTYLAQLLIIAAFWRAKIRPWPVLANMGLCVLALLIGIASLLIDVLTIWHDQVEDAVEWMLALILNTWFLVAWLTWKLPPTIITRQSTVRELIP